MIELIDVSKKYGENYALKDVNAVFKTNKTTVVIGSSGSGKSTLLRCINSLEKITSGKIFIDNIESSDKQKLPANALKAKIGMVFQSFNLFPHMTVKQNLIYAPTNALNITKQRAQNKAEELLKDFKLLSKLNSMTNDLSGGQKQRVAICRVLMMNPDIILFDEPTSALDPETIKDVIEVILMLKSKNITMIVVTHHVKFAKLIADEVIFMDNGLILEQQDAKRFFDQPKSQRAKLFLNNIGDMM
ncbi:MAG: amino acid ABC transporter ATP-binding protein [Rickettsiaceae bacterium]